MSENVTIQFTTSADAYDIQTYASDPRISESSNVPYPYPENGGEVFVNDAVVARSSNQRYAFSIRYKDEFAGIVSLLAVNLTEGKAELGYWIAVPFWGLGIGTIAVKEVVTYAFATLNLSELYSECLARNVASARVLEKNGFMQTWEFMIDGAPGAKFTGELAKRFRLSRIEWEKGTNS